MLFSCLLKIFIFKNKNLSDIYHLTVNSLTLNQAQHFVGPDLCLNCLQKLSADKELKYIDPDKEIL